MLWSFKRELWAVETDDNPSGPISKHRKTFSQARKKVQNILLFCTSGQRIFPTMPC